MPEILPDSSQAYGRMGSSETFFKYGDAEKACLARQDARLGGLIRAVGHINRRTYPDPFHALVHFILGQQVGGAVHRKLWQSYVDKFGALQPHMLAAVPREHRKSLGTSSRKVAAILRIAEEFACGNLDSEILARMDDESLEKTLTALPGIGPWTVAMLKIFCFERQDVISWGDLGLRKGMEQLYGLHALTEVEFQEIARRYAPYRTIASFYLWELASGKGVGQQAVISTP